MTDLEKKSDDAPQMLEELDRTATVDTVHQDEALKVIQNYDGERTWTPEEEKRLTRRIDRKLISLLTITYGLQYYDKAMLSQAVSRVYPRNEMLLTKQGAVWVARRLGFERR